MHEFFEELRNDADDIDAKGVSINTITIGAICFVMCIVNCLTGSNVMAVTTGSMGIWCVISYLIYIKTKRYRIANISTITAVGFMMMYFVVSGGEQGFSIVWLLIVPPIGIFLFKLLYGGTLSILLGVFMTIYMWTPLHELGYCYSDTYRLRFPFIYFFITITSIYINYTILKYRQKQVALLELAQQASNSKSDFLANMSHEIRTPLNAVVGMCELILRENDVSDTVRDYCFNIQNSSRSLLSIINDILDFSKIESGRMEIINEEFNIASTINDVINMALTRKGDKPIEIIVRCDPNIPVGLVGDELRIRQIMINLVTNAIKFTNRGSVTIQISQTKHDYGINLSFSVIDTGIGISPENLEKLFSSFQQVNTKKNREVEGTGLGLAISKKLVTSMGGFINVSSTYGTGSKFSFVIPMKVADSSSFISVKDASNIHAAYYIDMTKYGMPVVAKEYTSLIEGMSEGMGVDMQLFDSFRSFRDEADADRFTHVFTERDEYVANRAYFEKMAENTVVVVVQDRINAIDVPSSMKCIFKPFYALTAASVFNNENQFVNINERRNSSIRFVAPKARVLVVDDNVINLKVAVGLMRPYHMQVMTVDSGRAAISMLRSKDIDIVFMDHMMPEMDGVEATQAIRNMEGSYYKNLPIIALTANAVNGVRDMYIEAGLNDFIAKPIELSALDRVLKTWLPRELIKAPSRGDRLPHGERRKASLSENKPAADVLFDPKAGAFYTGGDEEAYNEILEVYVRKAGEKIGCIKKLFEEKSWKNYVIEVHALKSTSLTIGSKQLSELAKELEFAGKAENYSLIEEKNDALLEMYEKVAELGRQHLKLDDKAEEAAAAAEQVSDEPLTEISAEKALEYIEAIRQACDSFDGDAVSAICAETAGFSVGGKALRPLFEEIGADANDFEYDSAAEKAAALKDKLIG